jgi:hypothetical protein
VKDLAWSTGMMHLAAGVGLRGNDVLIHLDGAAPLEGPEGVDSVLLRYPSKSNVEIYRAQVMVATTCDLIVIIQLLTTVVDDCFRNLRFSKIQCLSLLLVDMTFAIHLNFRFEIHILLCNPHGAFLTLGTNPNYRSFCRCLFHIVSNGTIRSTFGNLNAEVLYEPACIDRRPSQISDCWPGPSRRLPQTTCRSP